MTPKDAPERVILSPDNRYENPWHNPIAGDGCAIEDGEDSSFEYVRQDTIQATVDAALAECDATIAKLVEALSRVANWDLPESGCFYPNEDGTDSDRPAPYDSVHAYGSLGGRKAIRDIARAALASVRMQEGGE